MAMCNKITTHLREYQAVDMSANLRDYWGRYCFCATNHKISATNTSRESRVMKNTWIVEGRWCEVVSSTDQQGTRNAQNHRTRPSTARRAVRWSWIFLVPC
jgi:hypothetical protein